MAYLNPTAGAARENLGGAGVVTREQLEAEVEDLLEIVEDIPAADAEDSATVWNDAGVLKVSSAG